MKHIEINIGKACNHKCIFCMSGITRNKVLGFESLTTIKNEINKVSLLGYNSIGFLGGEPTIHPNFLDIVLYAKSKNFINIEVISNGTKFDEYDFLEKSIKNGLTRFSISVHSIYEKEESILVGGIDGIVKQKIKSIQNLLEFYNKGILKKEISVNIVISKVNYKSIKKTILFLCKLGIKSFRLNFIQLEGYSTENYEKLAFKYEDFRIELLNILSLSKKYLDLRINFEAIPWCFSGLNYIDYLKFSEQKIDREKDKISRDDVNLISRDIINQLDRRKELKVYIRKCDKCFLKGECEGIWKRYVDYFKIK
ncbi:MAG: radical SAM protein [Candidatus Gracilibacteria bacterium]|nr:radical SAM protein [Candidatus Gracilibacteria bacterium]